MKQNLFYSVNSGQVVRQLGFGYDYSTSYYVRPLSSRQARFSVCFSRLWPILAIRSAVGLVGKVMYRLVGRIFEAFSTVISSPVI